MAVTVAVPAEAMRGRHSFGDDHLGTDREAPDRGPAQNQIAELAVLLSNTRGSTILGGSVLSALTIGIAVEAAFSPSVLRPGLAGVVSVSLLGCVILCWLRAAALLLLAGRPVLDQLNDHRWRTGAPLDPRVRWLSHADRRRQLGGLVLGTGEHDDRRGPRPPGADPAGRDLDVHHRRVLPALDRDGPSGGVRRRPARPHGRSLAGPATSPPPAFGIPSRLPGSSRPAEQRSPTGSAGRGGACYLGVCQPSRDGPS